MPGLNAVPNQSLLRPLIVPQELQILTVVLLHPRKTLRVFDVVLRILAFGFARHRVCRSLLVNRFRTAVLFTPLHIGVGDLLGLLYWPHTFW